MPAILPIASAVVPSLIGGVMSNSQNKANDQNAANANNNAAQQQQQASAQAYQQNQQGIAAAMQRMQQYDASNPNPINAAGAIKGPPTLGPTAGNAVQTGGQLGGGTATGDGVSGMQTLISQILAAAKQPNAAAAPAAPTHPAAGAPASGGFMNTIHPIPGPVAPGAPVTPPKTPPFAPARRVLL